nr:hypothetical protein K2Z90_007704 [Rhodococcus opacus PD630]
MLLLHTVLAFLQLYFRALSSPGHGQPLSVVEDFADSHEAPRQAGNELAAQTNP